MDPGTLSDLFPQVEILSERDGKRWATLIFRIRFRPRRCLALAQW